MKVLGRPSIDPEKRVLKQLKQGVVDPDLICEELVDGRSHRVE